METRWKHDGKSPASPCGRSGRVGSKTRAVHMGFVLD